MVVGARPASINALTGIRAFAAAFVLVFHYREHISALVPQTAVLLPIEKVGFLGVDVFFVLSGFILSYNYLDEFRSFRLSAYARFLTLRFARIYPVHIFGLLLLVAIVALARSFAISIGNGDVFTLHAFVLNVLLLQAWTNDPSVLLSWNYPAWSVSAEWFAYMLFPMIALVLARAKSVGMAIGGAFTLLSLMPLAAAGLRALPLGRDWGADYLIQVAGEFSAGCFLYLVYRSEATRRWPWHAIGPIVCCAALAASLLLVDMGANSPLDGSLVTTLWVVPVFGTVILAVAHDRGLLAQWLRSRFMVYWGTASYSLYMTHAIVLIALARGLPVDKFAGSPLAIRLLVLACYLVVPFGVAAATHSIVEEPARQWLRRQLAARPGPGGPRRPSVERLNPVVTTHACRATRTCGYSGPPNSRGESGVMAETQRSPSVSIVVPTFNRCDWLRRLLLALGEQRFDLEKLEAVVVVDGATDGTLEMLRRLSLTFTLKIIDQPNSGPAAARNRGLEAAAGEVVIYLDDDVIPVPELIRQHLDAHIADTKAVVLGPIRTPRERLEYLPAWARWEALVLHEHYAALSSNMKVPTARQFFSGNASVRREHALAIGGFDETFRRGEDVEFGYRLEEYGLNFHFVPDAVVLHESDHSFDAWRRIPTHYGRQDVVVARDHARADALEDAFRRWHKLHPLTRIATRWSVGHIRRVQLLQGALSRVITCSGPLVPAAVQTAASGALFNLLYWQSVADESGSGANIWEQPLLPPTDAIQQECAPGTLLAA